MNSFKTRISKLDGLNFTTMTEITFELHGDFIELSKLLKAADLCESGGSAKYAIAQSLVTVDGQIETRKGFKVRKGMVVAYLGNAILVQ